MGILTLECVSLYHIVFAQSYQFFVGIGVFQAVVWLVPEPDVTNLIPASLPAVSKDNSKPSVGNSGLRQRKQEKSSEPAVAEPDDKENRVRFFYQHFAVLLT